MLSLGAVHRSLPTRLLTAFAIAVIVVATLPTLGGCLVLDRCDPDSRNEGHIEYSCAGTVVLGTSFDYCGHRQPSSPEVDCATQHQTCQDGACVTPCGTDADCGPAGYCAFPGICVPWQQQGTDCTYDSHCAPGLRCVPSSATDVDAGTTAPADARLDADASDGGDTGAIAPADGSSDAADFVDASGDDAETVPAPPARTCQAL